MNNSYWNYEDDKNIICPYCGEEYKPSYEDTYIGGKSVDCYTKDMKTYACDKCGKKFTMYGCPVRWKYHTETIDGEATDEEVEKIVSFIKQNGTATYSEDILESIENGNKTDKEIAQEQAEDDDTDPFLMDAIQTVVETGQASTSFIQRRFKVGYARAGRIIDQMEERGIISGYQGSKPREVLMTKERWAELNS